MKREFPRLVFTSPGPLDCAGGTYGHHQVADADEFDAAMVAGFFPTLPEALAGKLDPQAPAPESEPEPAPEPEPEPEPEAESESPETSRFKVPDTNEAGYDETEN